MVDQGTEELVSSLYEALFAGAVLLLVVGAACFWWGWSLGSTRRLQKREQDREPADPDCHG